MYKKWIKRLLDVLFSLMILLIIWPILIILWILVRIKLGAPAIFKQERPGFHEKIFQLYKFRSMTNEKDENGNLLPDEKRLTKFGKVLRSTSLDELPELINILKGDMSFVGPRPLLVPYLPYYTKEEHRRHDVLPGLTGLAQIHGRNLVTWDEKLKMDVEYVSKISFLTDIKIVLKTFLIVLKKEGINDSNNQIMKSLIEDREGRNHDESAT